ncbi:hypothetical protein OKJ48_02680 [Streptomyces kunmingensis]|uniref:Secreted protein/lipoprotein n=1 Tax=Streptomyces kunmingensis TaxID=68225 RepID=A0ABU6C384_9ACTN|nr:hypothetical protein [Streptomyces kunmingensis]MEB3959167.1 hypothetical protein [Streptomyces kunmingensis]
MTRAAHHQASAGIHRRKDARYIGITLAAAALSAAALTACSGAAPKIPDAPLDPAQPSTSSQPGSTPSPSDSDPDAALKKVVLDTYERMWDEQVKAYAKGSIKGTELRSYAAGYALAEAETTMDTFQEKGVVTKGAPTHDAVVTGLKPDEKVPWASLTDCLDTANWKYVYEKTGKPVEMPKDQVLKYVTKVQAEKWGNSWKIVEVQASATSC